MAASKRTGDSLGTALSKLNVAIARIEDQSSAGLYAAGLLVQREAQKKTPVDTGNLKGSAYTRKMGKLSVEVGFTAAYAIFVHENMDAHHPNGQAKFLESALNENRDKILKLIEKGRK